MEEILIEIKKAEERAAAAVENAQKRKAEIIHDAESEAARMKKTELEKFRKELDHQASRDAEKIAKKTGAVISEAGTEAQKLGRIDKKKADEARALLKKEFEALLRGKYVLSGKDV